MSDVLSMPNVLSMLDVLSMSDVLLVLCVTNFKENEGNNSNHTNKKLDLCSKIGFFSFLDALKTI